MKDLKGKYKDMGITDLMLMMMQMQEFTPEDKEEIAEIRREIASRKPTKDLT